MYLSVVENVKYWQQLSGFVACELTREQHETTAAAAATTITTIQSILESFSPYAESLQCLCSNYDTTTVYC